MKCPVSCTVWTINKSRERSIKSEKGGMSVSKGNLLKTYPAKMIIMHGKSEYVMTKEYGSF